MNNQNIISNKFELFWTTSFSYFGAAIFSKSRSLHCVFKKQRRRSAIKRLPTKVKQVGNNTHQMTLINDAHGK
jgi:hypothetical protein